MITKGMTIKLQKEIPGFEILRVGTEFQVENLTENGVITIISRAGRGMMSYEEFKLYFEEVKPKPVYKWSKWSRCENIELASEGAEVRVEFRSNGKRVEVRTTDLIDGSLKAYACCHEDDDFDVIRGLELAHTRLKIKLLSMLF